MKTTNTKVSTSMNNLNREDFFAIIDRNIRNGILAFEDICKARSDEELVTTLRHWQGQEGKVAARTAAIVRAEIMDRIDPSRMI
jgi:hypothetical protein